MEASRYCLCEGMALTPAACGRHPLSPFEERGKPLGGGCFSPSPGEEGRRPQVLDTPVVAAGKG